MRLKRVSIVFAILLASTSAVAGADQTGLRQIGMVDIPGLPGFDSVALINKHLIISHQGAGALDVFDPSRRRLVAKINGFGNTKGIAVNEADGRLYVADEGNHQIAVVSVENWQVISTIKLEHSPDSLLYIPEGKTLYAGSANDRSLTLVRTESSQPMGSIELDSRVAGLAYDALNKQVIVALEDKSELVVLSAFSAQAAVLRHIRLAASQPTVLLFDDANRKIYVAVRYAILAIDADSGNEVSRIPTAAGANSLWLDGPSKMLYSVASDGTVDSIRVEGGRLVLDKELKTDVRGSGIAYDAERKLIYVPGGRQGRSKLVMLKQFGPPNQDDAAFKKIAPEAKGSSEHR